MKFLSAFLVLSAGIGGLLAASPASAEPIYRYCMIGTPNMFMDCTFSTLPQCMMTASAGMGFCQENSAYLVSRQSAPAAQRR